jgi:hypothetical protein
MTTQVCLCRALLLIGSKFTLNRNCQPGAGLYQPADDCMINTSKANVTTTTKKPLEKSTSYLTLFFPELCVLALCAPCRPACLFVCLSVGVVVVTLLTTFIGIDLFGALFPIFLLLPRFLADVGVDILDSIDARPCTTDDLYKR